MSIPLATPRPTWRKRARRTATAVLAGDFDERPPRDALTSLLNGIPPYKAEWEIEWEKQESRREKQAALKTKSKKKELSRATASSSRSRLTATPTRAPSTATPVPPKPKSMTPVSSVSTLPFHDGRPNIHVSTALRLASVTPPPMSPHLLSTPASTPGPASSSTSRTSSKRLHTPEDFAEVDVVLVSPPPKQPQPKKRRVAVKKGWKGWVEGSPEPSDKLINLDDVPVMAERKTRSGKNFDAY